MPSAGPQIWITSSLVSFSRSVPGAHKQDRPCLRLDPAPPPTVNCKSPYKLQSYRRVGTDSACSHQQTTDVLPVFLAAISHTTQRQVAVIYISSVLKSHFLPEKLVKSRQKGEKRFLWSHCCASCGVAVGNKFWEEKQKTRQTTETISELAHRRMQFVLCVCFCLQGVVILLRFIK